MTTGRPPISPHPDRRTPVVSGLGADEAEVGDMMDGDEFLCGTCNVDGAVFGVEDDVDKELKASDEGEQAVRIAPLPTPFQPSLSQFTDHCVTHYPYQSWCPYCVEGRGREFGHHRVVRDQSTTPTVSFDYAFVSDNGDIETQEAYEAAGESAVKLLVVRDDKSKAIFGHIVPAEERNR